VKRPAFFSNPIDFPKTINLLDKQIARTFGENDREEKDTALEFGSTVLRHSALYHL
jgi:hypothetical protein